MLIDTLATSLSSVLLCLFLGNADRLNMTWDYRTNIMLNWYVIIDLPINGVVLIWLGNGAGRSRRRKKTFSSASSCW